MSGLGNIDKIAETINKTLSTARKPANSLPPFYNMIESSFRPGLSAIALTASMVGRLGEAGINTSTLPDGTEPLLMKFIRILNEEVVKEIQLKAKTMVEIPPGTLMGNAGPAPVVSTLPVQGSAIIF